MPLSLELRQKMRLFEEAIESRIKKKRCDISIPGSNEEVDWLVTFIKECELLENEVRTYCTGDVISEAMKFSIRKMQLRLTAIVMERRDLNLIPVPLRINDQHGKVKLAWARIRSMVGIIRSNPIFKTDGKLALGVKRQYWLEGSAPHLSLHDTAEAYAMWNPTNPYGFAGFGLMRITDHLVDKSSPRWYTESYARHDSFVGRHDSFIDFYFNVVQTVRRALRHGSYALSGHEPGVIQLSERERKAKRLVIRAGQLFDAFGQPADTMDYHDEGRKGWGAFVQDLQGHLYIGQHETRRFHHSSFLASRPVLMAGYIAIRAGRILAIDRRSGHYQPGIGHTRQFLTFLKNADALGSERDLSPIAMCINQWRDRKTWYNVHNILKTQSWEECDFGPNISPPVLF